MSFARFSLSLLVLTLSVQGATVIQTSIVGTAVPDNDDIGLVDTQTINDPSLGTITSITVGMEFSGGWNGDLYAYLSNGSGFAVLLNRPGRTSTATDGAGSSGLTITLDDNAFQDVHTGLATSGSDVSGVFQSDGRETDPLNVLDTDSRTAMLSGFLGLSADGEWTLFVADQAAGGVSTLESWTLDITTVPEPGTLMLAGLSVLLACRRRRRPC